MSWHKYHSQIRELGFELAALLSKEELYAIEQDLAVQGGKAWVTFVNENLDEISAFLAATPAQRNKKKAWQAQPHRRRLIFAAIYFHRHANLFLKNMIGSSLDMGIGLGYRSVHAAAADAGFDFALSVPEFFPLKDIDWYKQFLDYASGGLLTGNFDDFDY